MKASILGLCLLSATAQGAWASQKEATAAAASSTKEEQELISLSKDKWRWMTERNVDSLAALLHEQAVFVHMGVTLDKSQELDVIKSGGIVYKNAFVAVGDADGIAPPAVMERRVAAWRRAGTEVEYHKYRGVGHGFGLGVGTSAENWIADAIRFWAKQIQRR